MKKLWQNFGTLLLILLTITSQLTEAAETITNLRERRESYGPFEGGPGYGRAIFPASVANQGNMWGTGIGTSVHLRLGGYNNGFLLSNSVMTVFDTSLAVFCILAALLIFG